MVQVDGIKKTRIEHYGLDLPHFAKHLRTFGKAGTVKIGKKNKVNNYGTMCIFIGCASRYVLLHVEPS
jgi:hypothetical protein